jgi:glutathione synthase/RimK-type ligase-like ATP-grasp enzyme
MSEIAIFSTSVDSPTYEPVVRDLSERGYDVWVYSADRVAKGIDSLEIRIGKGEDFKLIHNEREHSLSTIKSAWYRHPYLFNMQMPDKAKEMCIEREIDALQESVWQQIPDNAWLNHPAAMTKAQAKLSQLSLAQTLGFSIPNTIIANRWNSINGLLDDETIIVKMSKGLTYEANKARVLYTTKLSKSMRNELSTNNPFPGIYQEYLEKKREWRITVVGDDAFEAAIYTEDEVKDDWRKHQFSSGVRFSREYMPKQEIKRCISFLGHLGLTYGTFDFVEDKDGKITFLECNTNGQFRWLEDTLGFPISNAIADVLIQRNNQ